MERWGLRRDVVDRVHKCRSAIKKKREIYFFTIIEKSRVPPHRRVAGDGVQTLSFFISAPVLALYRRTLRSVERLRGSMVREVDDIREEVQRSTGGTYLENNMDIRACMLNGERQAILESGAVGSGLRGDADPPAVVEAEEQDKWISSSEFHDESDVLGRVGKGWPWRRFV